MDTVEIDAVRDMQSRTYDPFTTPYKIDKEQFPLDGTLDRQFTHLVRYAVLAPSSHNTQPWKFRFFENGIAVFADYTRRLPVADPNNRELLMGVGAAIMNLRVAAMQFGFDVSVEYNFGGDSEMPIAFLSLSRTMSRTTPGEPVTMLFNSISKRHTNRHPFLMARVPDAILAQLFDLGEGTGVSMILSTDAHRNSQVAHLVAKAERFLHADPEFRKEFGEWLRPNKTLKADGITGAAFGISDVASTLAPWAMKTMDMSGFQAKHDERLCVEAPALCVFKGEDSVQTWLAVGEVLQRVLLSLTREGLQFSFFNMPIELPDARLELRRILGISSWPQLLLRIGYSLEQPAPSPRRPVEECIVYTAG